MKRHLLIPTLIVVAVVVAGAVPSASPDAPQPTVAQLKAKIRQQANRIGDLNDEIDAQDAVIADQNDTITRFRARDPLDAVLARSPDGLWNAMRAIWLAFPALDPGALCGYDRSNVPADGVGLTLTSYTFYRWQGC